MSARKYLSRAERAALAVMVRQLGEPRTREAIKKAILGSHPRDLCSASLQRCLDALKARTAAVAERIS